MTESRVRAAWQQRGDVEFPGDLCELDLHLVVDEVEIAVGDTLLSFDELAASFHDLVDPLEFPDSYRDEDR